MSEAVTKTIVGVCEEISEKNGWTRSGCPTSSTPKSSAPSARAAHHRVETEIIRLRNQIRADHAAKAVIGGSPCVCDVCASAAVEGHRVET